MANILGNEHLINQCIENHGDNKNLLLYTKKSEVQVAKILHQMSERNSWESCYYCPLTHFDCVADFIKHLQERHCTREGGSYVCRYGFNGVCPSLPLDGVSDRDYDDHVLKYHVNQQIREMAPEWTVFSASQNLPAALNDPSRGKQSNLFTKHWGLDFVEKTHISPSPYIPDITLLDFEKYSNKIGKRYRRHECLSMKQNLNEQHEPYENEASLTNSSTNNNNNNNNNNPVPDIFFKETLNLQKPHIFAKVFPGIMQTQNGEQRRQTGRLLQEQLSHYLDTIEVKIAQQVSQKSAAFFHAMTSQDAITNEMEEAIKKVKYLRQQLSILHESIVTNAFHLLRYGQRRHNFVNVLDKLHLMATVHKTQPMLQLLLGTQDYVAALDLIATTQEVLTQELMGVHCFKHLPMQLNEMEKLIDKMLITEFERYATTSLNRPLKHPLANSINDDDDDGDDDDDDHDDIEMEDKLICILMGLLRKKNFKFIDIFKEESIVTLRTIIKQLIIEYFSTKDMEVCLTGMGGEEDAAAIHLTINECIILLNKLTITLLIILKRIKLIIDIMKRIIDMAAGSGIGINLNINNINNINNNKNDDCSNNDNNDINDINGINGLSHNSDNIISDHVNSLVKNNVMDNSNRNNSTMDLIDTDIVFLVINEKNYIYDKLNELLCNVCGYCLERCSNLISNHNQKYKRPQNHSHNYNQHQNQQQLNHNTMKDMPTMPSVATIDELLHLSQLIDRFTDGCLQLTDTITSNPLKVALQVQSARFAHKFHTERKQKLSLLLDGERWRQIDIPTTFQKMLDYIHVNGLINLPKLFFNEEFTTEASLNATAIATNQIQLNPILLIDCERYALVGSVLFLIQMICEYCCCTYNLPIVASYLSHNIIDLLRLYNSRSCQLVMCGGALKVAGLKTITATNLALVCKSLQLLLWLLPKVKEYFKQLDPLIGTLIGYDQLEKDFISHMMEIENKICNIVNDCINGQLNKWNARPPIPSTSFRNISRDLVKLKEAISCILSAEQIRNIYLIIHKNFKDKLREQLRKLNIINNGGPQHGAVTSELLFYIETMHTLDALPSEELNHNILENIWEYSN